MLFHRTTQGWGQPNEYIVCCSYEVRSAVYGPCGRARTYIFSNLGTGWVILRIPTHSRHFRRPGVFGVMLADYWDGSHTRGTLAKRHPSVSENREDMKELPFVSSSTARRFSGAVSHAENAYILSFTSSGPIRTSSRGVEQAYT